MDDLIAFVAARLDEDEAAAKAARGVEWDWRYVAQPFGERPSIAHTVHIARHDPARALREVKAKRAIIRLHLDACDARFDDDQWNSGHASAMGAVVEQLAAVYSGHPDYRAEWKP